MVSKTHNPFGFTAGWHLTSLVPRWLLRLTKANTGTTGPQHHGFHGPTTIVRTVKAMSGKGAIHYLNRFGNETLLYSKPGSHPQSRHPRTCCTKIAIRNQRIYTSSITNKWYRDCWNPDTRATTRKDPACSQAIEAPCGLYRSITPLISMTRYIVNVSVIFATSTERSRR